MYPTGHQRGSNRNRTKPKQFIYHIKFEEKEEIVSLLTINEHWKSLAMEIKCNQSQIQKFEQMIYKPGNSPANAVWDYLSSRNTDIEKMFMLLLKIELYRGMDILKPYVKQELHCHIRHGPVIDTPVQMIAANPPSVPAYSNPAKVQHIAYSPSPTPRSIVEDDETRSMNISIPQQIGPQGGYYPPQPPPPDIQQIHQMQRSPQTQYISFNTNNNAGSGAGGQHNNSPQEVRSRFVGSYNQNDQPSPRLVYQQNDQQARRLQYNQQLHLQQRDVPQQNVPNQQYLVHHQQNMIPQQQERILPPQHSMIQQQHNMPPQQQNMRPQQQNMTQQQNIITHQKYILPQQQNMVPQQQNMIPQQQNLIPQQQNMIPQQQNLIPQQRNVIPHQQNVIPHQQQNQLHPPQQYVGQQASPDLRLRHSPQMTRSPLPPGMASDNRDIPGSTLQPPAIQQIAGTSPTNQTTAGTNRTRYISASSVSTTSSYTSITNLQRVTKDDLSKATNNWHPDLKLGKGGYGEVYRGKWAHQDVAIKRIKRDAATKNHDKLITQCFQEIGFLNSSKSDFILQIRAYCDDPEDPCIVTQFMVNGSLDDRLKRKGSSPALSWMERYKIAVGTANGLQFLHSKFTLASHRLVHGDIKPGNILLDQNMMPKIADFGLAREMDVDASVVMVSQISGTQFYLPHEYIQSRVLTPKVDTYSFGVVLFDIITAKSPNTRPKKGSRDILRDILREEDVNFWEYVDTAAPVDREENGRTIVEVLYEYGLRCTKIKAKERPEMETVFLHLDQVLNPWELQMKYDSIKSQTDRPEKVKELGAVRPTEELQITPVATNQNKAEIRQAGADLLQMTVSSQQRLPQPTIQQEVVCHQHPTQVPSSSSPPSQQRRDTTATTAVVAAPDSSDNNNRVRPPVEAAVDNPAAAARSRHHLSAASSVVGPGLAAEVPSAVVRQQQAFLAGNNGQQLIAAVSQVPGGTSWTPGAGGARCQYSQPLTGGSHSIPDFEALMNPSSSAEVVNNSGAYSNSTDMASSSTINTTSTIDSGKDSKRFDELEDLASNYAEIDLDGW